MPHRQRYLFVCTHRRPAGDPRGSCADKGSEEIVKRIKGKLAELGSAHKVVRACASGCLDLCPEGVSMVQEPDHVAYGNVRLEDVAEIAEALSEGRVVQRLLVHPKPEPGNP